MQSAVLIYNPAAGTRKPATLVAEIAAGLARHGVAVESVPTTGPGAATAIATEVAASGRVDTLLTLGGDGTVREAAKGLLGSDTALGPLPGGTTNVVCRALGLPLDPLRAAVALSSARSIQADVGLCNDEPFLMLASLGLDAAIMEEASTRLKNLTGRLGVAMTGMRTWLTYEYPRIPYSAEGLAGEASLLAVCNIAQYAGDFLLAPQASFTDRSLHLVTFTGSGRWATARFLLRLIRGRHVGMRQVDVRRVDEVTIPAPLVAPLELDGDPMILEGPLTVRRSDRRLALLTCQA